MIWQVCLTVAFVCLPTINGLFVTLDCAASVKMSIKKGAFATLEAMRQVVKTLTTAQGFDRLYDQMRVISAEDGKVHCELDITKEMLNGYGSLHGGFTALLVDAASTYALANVSDNFGVSVDMNISYFKPVFENDTIAIHASTLKCGKSIGVGNVDFFNKGTGELIAQGRHTKFMAGPGAADKQ